MLLPRLRHGDRCGHERTRRRRPRARRADVRARTLLEDVDELLRNADASPADLDALVVGTGPGSFTSTRIGLAVAQGLGLALELPVAGISTLEALASEGRRLPGRRRSPPRGLRPARACSRRPTSSWSRERRSSGGGPVSGDARGQGGPRPRRRRRDPPPARALACGSRERVPAAEEVAPLYVRSPDARSGAPREPRAATTRAARSRHGRGHRARVVSDPVVTLDVRR